MAAGDWLAARHQNGLGFAECSWGQCATCGAGQDAGEPGRSARTGRGGALYGRRFHRQTDFLAEGLTGEGGYGFLGVKSSEHSEEGALELREAN